MNEQQQQQWGSQVKAALSQAQPDAQVRQQLALARQTVLRTSSPTASNVLVWLEQRPFAAVIASGVLLAALLLAWQQASAPVQSEQYADVTAQVVDDVLYESLSDS
jgi:hypothetical protein